MKKKILRSLFILTLFLHFLIPNQVNASSIMGGSIHFSYFDTLTYKLSVGLYTKNVISGSSDSILVSLGDGSSEYFLRVNGVDSNGNGIPDGDVIFNGEVTWSLYRKQHSYTQPSFYVVSYSDQNRMDGIANIENGNAVNVPFYIEDSIRIGMDYNSEPVVNGFCYYDAYKGLLYSCYQNAWDMNGDSLNFELTMPLSGAGTVVPAYQFPDQVSPNANNHFTMNAHTGALYWSIPPQNGVFVYAFKVKEFRGGVLLSSIIYDQILYVKDSTTLGIEDFKDIRNYFSVYPNPTASTSSLTINIDETLLGSNLSITDITGREVLHSAVQIRNPQFDIRNFLPGVYLVSVTSLDGRKAVKKLLIE